jgi:RND family efflux transporter MFP subunit
VLEARELQVSRQQAQAGLAEARAGIPEADGALESAQAQLDLAQVTLRRMRELFEKRSVSQHELDQAAAQSKVAEAARTVAQARRRQLDERIRQAERAIEAVETQLAYLEVLAPYSGRVTARLAEPGALALPGAPLLELESDAGYRLEAAVPEAHSRSVRQGQTVEVRLDAAGGPLTARVEEIVPEIDAASRSFMVKIALPARSEVRGGLFGRAFFGTGDRTVLAIPREAIFEQGQTRGVWIVADGAARSRFLRLGEERNGQVEILSGLTAGERIVSPRLSLADGQPVEVRP